MIAWRYVLIIVLGYLLGNISFSMLIAKRQGIDIRQHGSKSAGTTNMLRTLGPLPSLLTFLGDVGKGALGAAIGYIVVGHVGAMVGGVAVIVGHNWPALYRFKGGKGIAASIGAMLVVQPLVTLVLLGIAVVIIAVSRVVSYASIGLTLVYFLYNLIFHFQETPLVLFALAVFVLAWVSHRENIVRILRGEEKNRKISFRSNRSRGM